MSLAMKAARVDGYEPDSPGMGDPGLFGFLGRTISGAAKGFIKGGPVGAVGGGLKGAVKRKGRKASPGRRGGTKLARGSGSQPLTGRRTETNVIEYEADFGAPGQSRRGNVPVDDVAIQGCPPGYHPNKSDYYRRTPRGTVFFVPKGHACVKNRRRNPGNSRANDRAISRIKSAKRMAKSLGRISIREGK